MRIKGREREKGGREKIGKITKERKGEIYI